MWEGVVNWSCLVSWRGDYLIVVGSGVRFRGRERGRETAARKYGERAVRRVVFALWRTRDPEFAAAPV